MPQCARLLSFYESPFCGRFMKTLEKIRLTAYLRLFSFLRIPLLGWVRPSIIEMNEHKTVLAIPLSRRSRNHIGVMYFGALAMGGEAAVAFPAVLEIQKSGKPVTFLFKNFKADFKKRCEGDVHFLCDQGAEVRELIHRAIQNPGERFEGEFQSRAVVPSVDANEVAATFTLTLSTKLNIRKPKA